MSSIAATFVSTSPFGSATSRTAFSVRSVGDAGGALRPRHPQRAGAVERVHERVEAALELRAALREEDDHVQRAARPGAQLDLVGQRRGASTRGTRRARRRRATRAPGLMPSFFGRGVLVRCQLPGPSHGHPRLPARSLAGANTKTTLTAAFSWRSTRGVGSALLYELLRDGDLGVKHYAPRVNARQCRIW